MAQTRIRYRQRKRNKNEMQSIQKMKSETTGAIYDAIINPTEVTYKIVNTRRGEVIRTGGEKINNLEILKRHVKTELMSLGVKFEAEIRPSRRKTKVGEGAGEEVSDKTTVGESPQLGLPSEGETEGS